MALDPNRPGRIRCDVIGCRRTAAASKYPEGTHICCGKCWRVGGTLATRRAWSKWDREAEALDKELRAMVDSGVARADLPEDKVKRVDLCAAMASDLFTAIVQKASEARAGI